MSKGSVLVTGASGYIAGFTIRQLLAEGWSVRGTVRSLSRAPEVHKAIGIDPADLPLFAADLTDDAGWEEAVAGADYVQHIASPLPSNTPKSADELIVPARDGALRVLRAARDAGVKRVVMTSSVAAIAYGGDCSRPFTEADWTDPSSSDAYPYVQSKTIAERAARDFMAAEGGELEYCTINPGAVLGPLLGSDFSASLEIVKKLMSGALPGLPRFGFPVVDVRDIADAHVKAMTAPNMNGERFLCAGEYMWMEDVARTLKNGLGDRAKRVPTRRLPDFLVRLSALFDPEVRSVVSELGKERRCDASHARNTLGWTTRPERDTIVETAESMLAAGLVKA